VFDDFAKEEFKIEDDEEGKKSEKIQQII